MPIKKREIPSAILKLDLKLVNAILPLRCDK
jgi:hypothetical protein